MTSPLFRAGSVEYLTVTVTADVELGAQPVSLSMNDGVTWLPCEWVGAAGTTRKARTVDPVTFTAGTRSNIGVLVKITDEPEVPIVRAGSLTISP